LSKDSPTLTWDASMSKAFIFGSIKKTCLVTMNKVQEIKVYKKQLLMTQMNKGQRITGKRK